MRAAGIIAEYNPFHNGHERHIRETRMRTDCDVLIVAMNGSISQRGEMMLLDKWTRAEMALRGGADIVVELPVLWGARPAENFAFGGVYILHALGCRWLSFGCETDDADALMRVADLLESEPQGFLQALKDALAQGKSFVRARAEAISACMQADEALLSGPNAALGIEYIRAIRKLGSAMQPVIVRRETPHHAEELAPETSASAIRSAVLEGRRQEAQIAMPGHAYELLAKNEGAVPSSALRDIALLSALRARSAEQIGSLPDVGEGLENLLYRAAREAGTRNELISMVKSKRYTHARLSRILAHAMIETSRDLLERRPAPTYVRLLGARRSALGYLGEMQKNSALPVFDRGKALENDICFCAERRATDMRALLSRDPQYRRADADLTHRFLIVE